MNFLKGISDEKLAMSETNLMAFSGLGTDEYAFTNVSISNGNTIHTLTCGKGTIPLVMVHGYGGSCMFFYKIYKDLAQHFKIYSIDLLGYGSSSRPKFKAKKVDEAEQFFVQAIEEWRQSMNLEKFVMIGHSFGGYVSSVYALQFPQYLIKLILLSPVGVPAKPEGHTAKKEIMIRAGKNKGRAVVLKITNWLWKKGVSPFSLLRCSSRLIAMKLIKKYAKRRLRSIQGDELNAFEKHLYQISMRKGSGEYALNVLIEPKVWARNPLELRLVELRIPLTFLYGDRDWMDYTAAQRLVHNLPIAANLEIVSGSNHHLYFDNPSETVRRLLNNLDIVFDPEWTIPNAAKNTNVEGWYNPEENHLIEDEFKIAVLS